MRTARVGTKLTVLAAATVTATGAVAACAAWALDQEADASARLSTATEVIRSATLVDMFHDATNAAVQTLLLDRAEGAPTRTLEDDRAAIDEAGTEMLRALDGVAAGGLDPRITDAVDAVRPTVDDYAAQGLAVADAAIAGSGLDEARRSFDATFERLVDELPVVADAVEAANAATLARAESTAGQARTVIVLVAALAGALSAALSFRIRRSILGSVRRTVGLLSQVAAGDLTGRLPAGADDEFGQMARDLNHTLDSVSAMLDRIEERAGSVAASSIQVSQAAGRLSTSSRRTADQADVAARSVEEISAEVSGIAVGTGEVSASMAAISADAHGAESIATRANEIAGDMGRRVAELGSSTAEIGSVTEVIAGIARQTTLLALNATIEAERAGESGRGFAVVAQEVKELSRLTAQATGEIAERIGALQQVAQAVTESITDISAIIDEVASIQSGIAVAVEHQFRTTESISSTVAGVSDGSGTIARSVESIARTTHDVSSDIDQTLDTAEELATLAHDLQHLIGDFRRR